MLKPLTLTAAALLAASHAGAVLPAADALAVGRPQLALVLLAGGAALWLRGRRRLGAASAALALATALPMAAAFLPPGRPAAAPDFRIYQKNLLLRAWPRRPLAADIIQSGAQVVTLQEVGAHNRHYMGPLWQAYPTQLACETGHLGAVAVLSRWPAVPGTAACGPGYALVRLAPPGAAPVWIASVHLDWPWPAGAQAAQARALALRLAALEGPVIVAGDFNMQPWGASVRRIARAAGSAPARPARITYPGPAPVLPLAIDHVLLPRDWSGTTMARPREGSDHLGLLVTVAPRG
jgi:endonuclease/exonuclease/phosphatase (EEP) superfamily protein YafD